MDNIKLSKKYQVLPIIILDNTGNYSGSFSIASWKLDINDIVDTLNFNFSYLENKLLFTREIYNYSHVIDSLRFNNWRIAVVENDHLTHFNPPEYESSNRIS